MKLFLNLISTDQSLCRFYIKEQEKLIPKDILSKPVIRQLNAKFIFGAFNPLNEENLKLEQHLIADTLKYDGVILLVDVNSLPLHAILYSSYFIVSMDVKHGTKLRNAFHSKLTRALKNYACLYSVMSRSESEQVMSLPIRNFKAPELESLVKVFRNRCDDGQFQDLLGFHLEELKKRKTPRRSTNAPEAYLVDDENNYFRKGHEKHARMPTGKPHNEFCEISGKFRFGKKIDSERHFNVMRERRRDKISGFFQDCHDSIAEVKQESHLNMFSNDYY